MTVNVHSIRVIYTREKQPKDYEKAVPTIEFSASLEDGADHVEAGLNLMRDACDIVYSALGMATPKPVATRLGEPSATSDEPAAAAPEPVKKAPAKVSETTAEPAKKAPAKKTAAKETPPVDDGLPDDGLPEETTPEPAKKAAVKTADSELPDDGLPDDATNDDDVMNAEDLQKYVASVVTSKKLNVANMKSIMSSFGASRVSEIPEDKRAAFREAVEAAVSG